jgi:hypothetical protein
MGAQLRLLVLVVVSALLVLPATAAARHRGRPAPECRRLAGKHPVAAAHGVYVFLAKGGNTYKVCAGRGKVRTLPNQDGGLTNQLSQFTIAGNFLAWDDTELIDPVAPTDDYVSVMNVTTGKQLVSLAFSWPNQNTGNNNASVVTIVLAPDGSVAWLSALAALGGGPNSAFSVVRIGSDGSQSTLAMGPDLSALTASANGATVSWTDNGNAASAPLA